MLRRILQLTLAVALLSLVALPAQAASVNQMLVVDIPYSFHVQQTRLPAGEYGIQPTDPADPTVMVIESRDVDAAAMVNTLPLEGTWDKSEEKRAKLVFSEIDDHLFLDEIWVPAHSNARRIPDSDMEESYRDRDLKVEERVLWVEMR